MTSNIEQKGVSIVNHNGKVYSAGGFNNDTTYEVTNSFYVLDDKGLDNALDNALDNSKWIQLASMLEKRAFFGLISHEGNIYAFGGKNTSGNFERYNEILNIWETVNIHSEYSNIIRYGFGYSIIDQTLFISGGILYEHDNIFHSDNPKNNSFIIENDCSLFYDNYAHSSLVETLDLKTFSIKYHSRLNIPRAYHKMENMTVFGGQVLDDDFDSSSDEEQGYVTNTQTIEKYNNKSKKWIILNKIFYR